MGNEKFSQKCFASQLVILLLYYTGMQTCHSSGNAVFKGVKYDCFVSILCFLVTDEEDMRKKQDVRKKRDRHLSQLQFLPRWHRCTNMQVLVVFLTCTTVITKFSCIGIVVDYADCLNCLTQSCLTTQR